MTIIKFTYSPLGQVLTVENRNRGLNDCDFEETVYVGGPDSRHFDPECDKRNIAISVLSQNGIRHFNEMSALGILGGAAGWNMFLSLYLPDEAVDQIFSRVEEWMKLPEVGNCLEGVYTEFISAIEVEDECIVTLHDCYD